MPSLAGARPEAPALYFQTAMKPAETDELFESPFPSVDSLRPHVGRWVGYDEKGMVLVSGSTLRDAGEEARRSHLPGLCFFWVPDAAVIG